MSIQQKIRSSALKATAAIAIVEYTTYLPSEGRSSLTYHYLFDHFITPWSRRIFDPEGAHHIALDVVKHNMAPRLSAEGKCDNCKVNMKVALSCGDKQQRKLIFPGPIGLAAGFDKNGTAIRGLFDMGFSFVEIGSVTPLPQPGNAKPRSFRLLEDRGVINRFGFNSEGVDQVKGYLKDYRLEFGGTGSDNAVAAAKQEKKSIAENVNSVVSEQSNEKESEDNKPSTVEDEEGDSKNNNILHKLDLDKPLEKFKQLENKYMRFTGVGAQSTTSGEGENIFMWALGWAWNKLMTSTPRTGVLGVNLGKNKTSDDEVGDYTTGIRELGPYADYLVINVSSPNTPGLRSLQQRDKLHNLLASTLKARDIFAPHAPLFVKLAPDLSIEEMEDVAHVVTETGIDGMIISNTTNARPEALVSRHKHEDGGLSGEPIKERSTECIRTMYKLTNGKVFIIGVGGVGSGRDAYDKLKAGASLVEIYSMMVYEGPGVVSRIRKELADIILENGYKSVEDVVGADQEDIYWNRRQERVRQKLKERDHEKIISDL